MPSPLSGSPDLPTSPTQRRVLAQVKILGRPATVPMLAVALEMDKLYVGNLVRKLVKQGFLEQVGTEAPYKTYQLSTRCRPYVGLDLRKPISIRGQLLRELERSAQLLSVRELAGTLGVSDIRTRRVLGILVQEGVVSVAGVRTHRGNPIMLYGLAAGKGDRRQTSLCATHHRILEDLKVRPRSTITMIADSLEISFGTAWDRTQDLVRQGLVYSSGKQHRADPARYSLVHLQQSVWILPVGSEATLTLHAQLRRWLRAAHHEINLVPGRDSLKTNCGESAVELSVAAEHRRCEANVKHLVQRLQADGFKVSLEPPSPKMPSENATKSRSCAVKSRNAANRVLEGLRQDAPDRWLSVSEIALLVGRSRPPVLNQLTRLEALGFVVVDRSIRINGQISPHYRLTSRGLNDELTVEAIAS